MIRLAAEPLCRGTCWVPERIMLWTLATDPLRCFECLVLYPVINQCACSIGSDIEAHLFLHRSGCNKIITYFFFSSSHSLYLPICTPDALLIKPPRPSWDNCDLNRAPCRTYVAHLTHLSCPPKTQGKQWRGCSRSYRVELVALAHPAAVVVCLVAQFLAGPVCSCFWLLAAWPLTPASTTVGPLDLILAQAYGCYVYQWMVVTGRSNILGQCSAPAGAHCRLTLPAHSLGGIGKEVFPEGTHFAV